MDDDLGSRCDEAIKLERTVSAIYRRFAALYPGNHDFWWALHLEEDHHAAILNALRQSHLPFGAFPAELVAVDPEELRAANRKAEELLERVQKETPPEADGCRLAIALEEAATELLLQEVAAHEPTSPVLKLVKELVGDSRGHADRIREVLAALPEPGSSPKGPA